MWYQFKLKVWQIEWGAGAVLLRGSYAPTPPFATFTIQIGMTSTLDQRMNQGWTYQDQVDQHHQGLTVLEYYTKRYRHSDQSEWQARIVAEQILLNDHPTTADTLLEQGQRLTYHRPPWAEPEVPLDFEVIYEDPDLLVVAKPAGLPVLPAGGFLKHTLLWQLKRQYSQEPPVPIHRLGRGTSGLMLLARSSLARSHLSQQLRNHQMGKYYRALIGPSDLPDRFTITEPIGKVPHPVLGHVYAVTPNGQFARSDCQVLKRHLNTTLLAVKILTGRPHQIRIHLAAAGYPLVGDPLYDIGGLPKPWTGANFDRTEQQGPEKFPLPGDCGYHLHAYALTFAHPRTGQAMSFTCPAPPTLI